MILAGKPSMTIITVISLKSHFVPITVTPAKTVMKKDINTKSFHLRPISWYIMKMETLRFLTVMTPVPKIVATDTLKRIFAVEIGRNLIIDPVNVKKCIEMNE